MDKHEIKEVARKEFNRQFNAAVIIITCGFVGWQAFTSMEWWGFGGIFLGVVVGREFATHLLGGDD